MGILVKMIVDHPNYNAMNNNKYPRNWWIKAKHGTFFQV